MAAELDLDLHKYGRLLRRWWWLLSIGTILPMLISGYLLSREPGLHRSQVALLVGPSLQSYSPNHEALEASASLAQTYADLARRPFIIQAVIDEQRLPYTLDELTERVTAWVKTDSQVLEIAVVDPQPDRAQAVAGAIAQALIQRSPAGRQDMQEQMAFVQQQLLDLQGSIRDLEERLRTADPALARLTDPSGVDKSSQQVTALREMLDAQRQTYSGLLELYGGGASTGTLTVIQPPTPGRPLGQPAPAILAVAGLVGAMLAGGGVALNERLDDSLHCEGRGRHTCLGLPVLGSIGRLRGPGPLFYWRDPSSRHAAALRDLWARICLANPQAAPRLLLVTSPVPLDGKSFQAANLAAAVAARNLRSPTLHRTFGARNARGLAEALLDGGPPALEEILVPTRQQHLWLVPAGRAAVDAALALGSPALRRMLHDLGQRFGLIILDSPAETAAPDASILAALADATLLVVRDGWTRREPARHSLAALAARPGANVIGVFFNRAHTPGAYGPARQAPLGAPGPRPRAAHGPAGEEQGQA